MTERLPHHELRMLLGAYVLGGLDSADRRQLEAHLAECTACTAELAKFAAVPPLLRLAAPPGVDLAPEFAPPAGTEPASKLAAELAPPDGTEPPAESLPRLIKAARAQRAARRRRRWLLAAAVLLVLAGLGAGILLLAGRDTEPPPTAVVSVFNNSRVGDAVLAAKVWGTEVRLDLNYPARGRQPYTAWAIASDGHQEQAATWTTPANGHCVVTGATSIQRDQLDHVEVRTADGRTVLRTG